MGDNSKELKVQITTVADTAGAKATEDSLRQIADVSRAAGASSKLAAEGVASVGQSASKTAEGTKQAAHESKGLGEQLAGLGSKNAAAREALEGIDAASRGGAAGLFGLAKAFKSLFEVAKVGSPFGLITTGIALAVGAASFLIEKLDKSGESAEKLAKELEYGKKVAEELGASSMKQLESSLKTIGDSADLDRKKFQDLLAAKERIDNAEQADLLAQVRNNPKLTEEQKVTKEATVRADFEAREDARKIKAKKEEVDIANRQLAETEQVSSFPEKNFRQALESLKKLQLAQGNQQGLQSELSTLQSRTGGTREEAFSRGTRIEEIVKELNAIDKKPVTNEAIEVAAKRVEETQKVVDADRAVIESAKQRVKAAQEELKIEQDTQAAVKKFRNDETKQNLTTSIATAKQSDRDKAAQRLIEKNNPEVAKLSDEKGGINSQIESLKNSLLHSQESSNSPDNKRLQQQIDDLAARRSAIDAQISQISAIPTKTDQANIDFSKASKQASAIVSSSDASPKPKTKNSGGTITIDGKQYVAVENQPKSNVATINGQPIAEQNGPNRLNGQPITASSPQNTIQIGGGALPGDKPKPLDTKPIEQGAKQESDEFTAVQEKSQEAINATGEEISKIKPAPPLNFDPISTGFTGYHEINMENHKESQKRISEAEKNIDRLRQQLSELARSSRN